MAEPTGEKSHDPTLHRRQQARAAGHVARSADVAAAILLCGTVLALYWLGRPIVDMLGQLTARQLGGDAWLTTDVPSVAQLAQGMTAMLATVLLPAFGLILVSAVLGNVLQVGLLFLPEKVMPDFSRIDPVQGASRLFSGRSATRFIFGLMKLAAVALVAWLSYESDRDRFMNCGQLPVPELAAFAAETVLGTLVRIIIALLAVAALDYGLERWRYERDLRMTDQELREELRSLNGNPQLAGRRRALRQQSARRALASDIAQASLMIVDSRGLAVAVKYDPRSGSAPLVSAKGAGRAGLDLIAAAASHRVPTVELPALARSLFEATAVRQPIPTQFYAAVAQALSKARPPSALVVEQTVPVANGS